MKEYMLKVQWQNNKYWTPHPKAWRMILEKGAELCQEECSASVLVAWGICDCQ